MTNTSSQPSTQEKDSDLSQFELTQRTDFPLLTRVVTVIGILLSLVHIWFNTLATLPELWVSAAHFAGFSVMCALTYPAAAKWRTSRFALAIDIGIAVAAVACLVYLILGEDALYERGVKFVTSDWVFSIIAILIALELIRRTMVGLFPA